MGFDKDDKEKVSLHFVILKINKEIREGGIFLNKSEGTLELNQDMNYILSSLFTSVIYSSSKEIVKCCRKCVFNSHEDLSLYLLC